MAFKKTFVLSDESINSYGFWILLSGMDLSGIQKNCPLYYEHRTWEIPLGHVENIRLKNEQLLGDVIIEGGDDREKELIRKIENGDIKGVSLGIDPTEWTEDAKMLKPGQTRATLSKCKPFELSLAPLPGNGNALALLNGKKMVTLSADTPVNFIPELNQKSNMNELAILLGLDPASTPEQIKKSIQSLQLKAANVEALQKVVETKLADGLSEPDKAFFLGLSKTNLTAALDFLNLKKTENTPAADAGTPAVENKTEKLKDMIQLGKKIEATADGKDSFDYLQRHNQVELGRIKREDPEKYQTLVAEYGTGVRYKA